MRLAPSTLILLLCSAVSVEAFVSPQTRVSRATVTTQFATPAAAAGADIEEASNLRGKVNEIDFCIAPADASISRSDSSLTIFLNNASNRAVRRILLARSWPSAEALNLSLRQILSSENREEQSGAKCPVPRPILNILMRRRDNEATGGGTSSSRPSPRSRSDAEYVQDQLQNFRDSYGDAPGIEMAAAFLECVLSLATSGIESERVKEVSYNLSIKDYSNSARRNPRVQYIISLFAAQ